MRQIVLKNQQGMAMFVAIMMLSLGSSFALLAWQVSSTELEISRYSEYEGAASILAESGVEKVISWVNNPAASPNPFFFTNLPETGCSGSNPGNAEYVVLPHDLYPAGGGGPFETLKGMGKIIDLRFYESTHPKGICTVRVLAKNTKGGTKIIEVELAINPLGAISAGIQGEGNINDPSPVWLHWGKIQYTGSANLGAEILKIPKKNAETAPVNEVPYNPNPVDYTLNEDYLMELHVEVTVNPALPDSGNDRPNLKEGENVVLDTIELNDTKRFIKQHGEVYIVSDEPGMLRDQQGNPKSFDELFGLEAGDESTRRLILIETDDQSNIVEPLLIAGGPYRGYFYFPEDIDIRIANLDGDVLTVQNVEPPPREDDTQPDAVNLSDLNLDGFFYVGGKAEIQDSFKVFGGIYAKEGFSGLKATDLELWYNAALASSDYSGVRRVTPLTGTWKTLPTM